MCLFAGNKSRRHYEEVSRPPRPVAPVHGSGWFEQPRDAPPPPPSSETRKRSKAQVKQALRDAEKIESNRNKKRFATSDKKADSIRENTLAKAKGNKARVPAPPPPRRPQQEIIVFDSSDSDSDSHKSAVPAPLSIKKKPLPPPPQKQQRAVKLEELGNTVPARKATATARPVVDESDTHPLLRRPTKPVVVHQSETRPAPRTTAKPRAQGHSRAAPQASSRKADQSRTHPAPISTGEFGTALNPAFRNLQTTPARPHRVEREAYSYLGSPENYANSPQEYLPFSQPKFRF